MKPGKFVLTSLVIVLLWGIFDFLIHSVGLMPLYIQTAHLWRPEAEMKSLLGLMWLSYAIASPILVYIYGRGYEEGKPPLAQGLRFGFLIGLFLFAPMALNCYVVMPIPVALALGWFVGGMIEMLVIGAVIGLFWRK